jgi:2-methylcitrate dehydratase PrpD
MKNGIIYEEKIKFNRGSPENPLSAYEVSSKFLANVTPLMSRKKAESIVNTIRKIDKLKDIRELINLCNLKTNSTIS